METSYSYKLKSHPDKLLIVHLEEVTKYYVSILEEKKVYQDKPELKAILVDLAYLMGAYHDITKAIKYFQHYLLSPIHEEIGPKSHALLSALFVKEIAQEYLAKTSLSKFEQALLAHFTFTIVKRHHGRLLNFEDEVYIKKHSDDLQKQIVVFEEEETEQIISHFAAKLNLKYTLQDFKKYILSTSYLNDMPDFFDDYIDTSKFDKLPLKTKMEYFYIHQFLFGGLLLSDKTDVILDQERNKKRVLLSDDLIESFRTKRNYHIPTSEIAKIKNQAFEEATNHLKTVFSQDKHIYSLTLPTGLGKTITSFAVALELKKITSLNEHRLIVAIPFTSIIDQNFEEYRQILDSNDSDILLKHHHLAEPIYKSGEDELTPNKSQFLIETWQSEVVVTTFVQLLNSIYSNDKALVMKLPNLTNSIIILDEIQTVPYEHWELLKNTFETLGSLYNCYFILMSATQPLIFLPQKEIIEIIPDYKKYFSYFNRTKIFNRLQKEIAMKDFVLEVKNYIAENPQKDVLVILNTKKHSKVCFEHLRYDIIDQKDEIYYLSTLITPFERKIIIKKIKDKSDKRKIIISTQLIEAGVDISVDTVFRAIAPIDSIIQAAGRANRYQEKKHQGEVYLYEIEEMKRDTTMIYGTDLIKKTQNVLKGIESIEEKDYLILIEKYFIEVRKQSEAHTSKYIKGISKLKFEDVGNFSFIEEQNTESVFLQLDDNAKKVWEEYKEIYENEILKRYEKKQLFAQLKTVFYDYVINVPIPCGKKNIDFDSEPVLNFYVSSLENPSRFYNYDSDNFKKNTGYQNISTLTF